MRYKESSFVARLRRQCQAQPRSIALPEYPDPRVEQAVRELLHEKSVREVHLPVERSVLPDDLRDSAAIQCIDDDRQFLTSDDDTPLLQAGTLLNLGIVDAALAGAVYTTAEVIRATIRTVGVAPGMKTVSGSFLMNREHPHLEKRLFLYADSGVVIDPNPLQLLDIARASIHTWRTVVGDPPPVVAFLSFSTKGSARHPMAEKMARAADELRKIMPEVDCDGELQFDAALSAEIGQSKCPESPVPGRANIFIFPNLDAGNLAYKITQRLGEFEAYGPILQGAGKPFSDLSRGATAQDIKASAYISLLRAKLPMTLA